MERSRPKAKVARDPWYCSLVCRSASVIGLFLGLRGRFSTRLGLEFFLGREEIVVVNPRTLAVVTVLEV